MAKHPVCYIIAGPNGAGKTTFAMEFLPQVVGCRVFVNADLIARGLSPLNVDAVAMEAGRLFLQQVRSRIDARQNFAFETTLSGLAYIRLIHEMRAAGYRIRLYYLWLPTIRLTLKRIAERVKRGGHDIPAAVATRRFQKGLSNLFSHYSAIVDYVAIFDNSSLSPSLVYEKDGKRERLNQSTTFNKIKKQAGV